MNQLKKIWKSFVNIGVSDAVSKKENKYVRFSNVIALITAVGAGMYIPLYFYKGANVSAIIGIGELLCISSVILLNYLNRQKTARYVYLAVVNVFTLVNACLIGHQSTVYEFFSVIFVVPFLLFSMRQYKHIVAGVLMATVSFSLYHAVYPFFTAYNLDLETQATIFIVSLWVRFAMFAIAFNILAFYNFSSETELQESNKQLLLQIAELKRSNEELEQFAYVISHDLRGPVRNISSFMNLLMTRCASSLAEDAKVFMQHSKDSSDKLSGQIDGLLSYCRIDRNLPPPSEVDINAMMSTIVVELNGKIAEKKAEVIVQEDLPVLTGIHSTLMHHVMYNLVSNAVKFNTSEKPQIKISCKEENDLLVFSISDNGIGIDSKFSSKLFQMFKRLHSPEQYEGIGVGLAVCKKIVTFYHGNIWFESELEKGTTFYFTLDKRYGQKLARPLETGYARIPILRAA